MKRIFSAFPAIALFGALALNSANCVAQNNDVSVMKLSTIQAINEPVQQYGGMAFFEGSFDQIKAEAKIQGKLIFMDLYATWCGPCKIMSSRIFPNEKAGTYMNPKFVNVKFDVEKGQGITLARTYKVSNLPTMLILNDKGEELGRILGSTPTAEDFTRLVSEQLTKVESTKK